MACSHSSVMSTSNIQEILQTEFPLIDSSLLAALLSDYQEPKNVEIQVDDSSLQAIRDTLTQLTLNVHAHDNQDASQPCSLDSSELGSKESPSLKLDLSEDSKESGESPYGRDDSTSVSGSTAMSMTSMSSAGNATFSSPTEFLNMLFPNLSNILIHQTFVEQYGTESSTEGGDIDDLSAVIDQLLSLEYIQDLAERGLDDEPESKNQAETEWKVVTSGSNKRGQQFPMANAPKKSKKPTTKVAFVDIRQRQHSIQLANQSPKGSTKPKLLTGSFITDPWTRLSSISARLSELLHPTPAGFFQSYFHAPQSTTTNSKGGWKMEGDALRNALSDLIKKRPANTNTAPNSPALQKSINALCDIIVDPGSDDSLALNGEQLLELQKDARLCIIAANGKLDTALDLLQLLKELDEAFVKGAGVAHLQTYTFKKDTQLSSPSTPTSSLTTLNYANVRSKPAQSPPPAPPVISIKSRPPDSPGVSGPSSSWTTVQRRPQKVASPCIDRFIPAYSNPNRSKQPVRGSGNRFGKGGKGDVGELDRDLTWYRDQRKEAMHQASRFWKSGSTKNRGGEIAFHYAEKAREFREQEHAKALEIARRVVNEKRRNSAERDTLDLHGLTIPEARVIVTEAVEAFDFSGSRFLKIITGRGKHSVDQVSVLGPAIKDMLNYDGYRVSTWDGGLIVRGR